jgi:hypothetical protein
VDEERSDLWSVEAVQGANNVAEASKGVIHEREGDGELERGGEEWSSGFEGFDRGGKVTHECNSASSGEATAEDRASDAVGDGGNGNDREFVVRASLEAENVRREWPLLQELRVQR